MSSSVSILVPNQPSYTYPDDNINLVSALVAKKVIAYNDIDNTPQQLIIGATSNIAVETKTGLDVHLDTNAKLNIFRTTIDGDGTRTEQRFMSFSETDMITTMNAPNQLYIQPNDSAKTTHLGNLKVLENDVSQLIDTDKTDIKVMKNLSVMGNINLSGQFFAPNLGAVNMVVDNTIRVQNQVANGSLYGNNINLWINKDDVNDKGLNQLGYGFYINEENEQLELFKYKRFNTLSNDGRVLKEGKTLYKKVAQFGYGVTSYDQVSDVFGKDWFETLDALAVSSAPSNATSSSNSGGSGGSFWVMNSNANIYYNGNVGICKEFPQYTLDVNGTIKAQDTVISNNFATASDARIKTDISSLNSGVCLERISMLSPCSFTMTTDNTRRTGLVAQEVMQIIPDAIAVKNNDALGISDFHYIDYNVIVGYLIGAIQELDKKVKSLEGLNRRNMRFYN